MATILVVDDNKEFTEVLTLKLERLGHTVTTRENGVGVTEHIAKNPVDLVITDIVMPDKEGLELIMELRKTHPKLKIIAISGGGRRDNGDYLATALRFGACCTLYKPFLDDQLTKALAVALEK